MKNITLTLLNLIFWATFCLAQSPSVHASEELYLTNEVEIVFRVADFAAIEGFQFSINWNPAHLSFVNRANVHPNLSFWLNTPESEPGKMRVTWVDFATGSPVTIADNEILFSLNFTVLDDGQHIPIQITDMPLQRIATINGTSIPLTTTDGLAFPINLPVEFESFEANYQVANRSVKLEWVTASEINSNHFEVQRSRNGFDFETTTSIDSRGNELQGDRYEYQDERPLTNQSYYRIKQVDFNGEAQYTEIRAVFVKKGEIDFSVGPNPARDFFVVNYSLNEFEATTVTIYDVKGRLALQEFFVGNDGMKMDISQLANGFYTVILKDLESGQCFSSKLVKH